MKMRKNRVNEFDKLAKMCSETISHTEESLKMLETELKKIHFNIYNREIISFQSREKVMDALYDIESGIYRSCIYDFKEASLRLQPRLQHINTIMNRLAVESNAEFLKIMNLKVVSLISFILDYCK